MGGSPSIAIATDFSDGAAVAMKRAAELARAGDRDRELVLLHNVSFVALQPATLEPVAVSAELEKQVHEASRRRLEAEVAELRASGFRVRAELITSPSTAHALVEAARRCDAELLVVGTRGLTGLPNVLLGSIAREIVRQADRPVLAVHAKDDRPLDRIRTVLVPSDFSQDATHAARAVARLLAADASAIRVVLATVLHTPALLRPLLGDLSITPATLGQTPDDLRASLEPIAAELRDLGFATETVCRTGTPSSEIVELAGLSGAHLVAMGTRGRSGLREHVLGSTAERVLQHAPCPVLAVPLPPREA